jgi:hypothetical protein
MGATCRALERNTRYILRSFSCNILLGCRLIDTSKTGKNSRFEAYQRRQKPKNRPETMISPLLELFLRYI